MRYQKPIRISIFFIALLLVSGCNKQKAEALKIAAERFRNDAISALDQMNFLFIQSMSVVQMSTEEEVESVVKDLTDLESPEAINAELLDFWSEEVTLGNAAESSVNSEFDDLKSQYYTFEGIFTSLDKGSFFAKEAVKNAEKHALNLTLQLINFSKILQNNDFRFTARRVLIIERMRAAKSEENPALQKELMENAAKAFVQLRIEEEQFKEEAIRQCLKSAESGRMVTELIRDYDKMKVTDILNSIKNSMNYGIEITGGNQKISDLLTKFEGVEKTIREDPYWKIILAQEIN